MALPTASSARDSPRCGMVSRFSWSSTGAATFSGLVSAACIDVVMVSPSSWLHGREFTRSSEAARATKPKSRGLHDERAAHGQADRDNSPTEDVTRARRSAAETEAQGEYRSFGPSGNPPQPSGL